MPTHIDGPASPCFFPIPFQGNTRFEDLSNLPGISPKMAASASDAPRGDCVGWGIPFQIGDPLVIHDSPHTISLGALHARWLVFCHTSDERPLAPDAHGLIRPMRGEGMLNEHAADYIIRYADGSEARAPVRRRHQVGAFQRNWGENCFESVFMHKPFPAHPHHEQSAPDWGPSQMRVDAFDWRTWMNWLWAWQNPHPEKAIAGLRVEPASGALVLSAISAGTVAEHPLRWQPRQKAVLRLPEGIPFQPDFDGDGNLAQARLDLGQIISAVPRAIYPIEAWQRSYNNQLPALSKHEVVLEYTAHPEACFHLWDERVIPVAELAAGAGGLPVEPLAPARQRVAIRVVEQGSRKPLACKLHLHGAAGEYLAPLDRHRIPNPAWFEDYSVDFTHRGIHHTTYIPGETVVDLPVGKVYLEVSKGFEIRPVRKVLEIGPETDEVLVEIEKALPWRERGWVTADTHVHFLSPASAMLEGAGEGVNVVNLLASQWGELMTNVGDFDGRTVWGAPEVGGGPQGDGEYLVRVGTENRQHVLGHISLLGYNGRIIAPMTTGGPDESALGDPIEVLLTEWARQCRAQGGVVVLPHFPNPRAEHAASVVAGQVDAVEMTSWGDLYHGISPYSLSDWYRYLNCGYMTAAVGGTDKMTANTAVGAVRTYARIPADAPFTYPAWMDAVRRADTFVSYGPLLEFSVDGHPMGSRIPMTAPGGTVDVTWQVASVTVPASRVELVVNGEVVEGAPVAPEGGSGSWSASGSFRVRIDRSTWLALLVRGGYPNQPEIITAHSSPVMVDVAGSQMLAAADAVTILEQIEGAMAYIDTVGTRAEDRIYRRMRLALETAHRALHNRMHQAGYFHEHGPATEHHGA